MNNKLFVVDTFTSERFKGNPTSVCFCQYSIDEKQMQLIAKELNLPVTAFVFEKPGVFLIRYFTPLTEIPACGHATLGAAAVIGELKKSTGIVFKTLNNVFIQTYVRDGMISMFYPKYEMKEFAADEAMLQALQITSYNTIAYCSELETVFIEMESPGELRTIQPDFKKLVETNSQIKEVVLTAVSDDKKYDYLLRSFCPWIGIDEDPVTGSVQAALAPYWAEKSGRRNLNAYQVSERGGELILSVEDDIVQIKGACVFVMTGELMIDE
jgi:PhzF family phenazine biosynthesis protein